MVASVEDHMETAKVLADLGADLNAKKEVRMYSTIHFSKT